MYRDIANHTPLSTTRTFCQLLSTMKCDKQTPSKLQHLITGCERKIDYKTLSEPYNAEDAKTRCSAEYRGVLPGNYPMTNLTNLQFIMKERDLRSIWLGIRKIQYDNAHWINSCSVGKSEVSSSTFKWSFCKPFSLILGNFLPGILTLCVFLLHKTYHCIRICYFKK